MLPTAGRHGSRVKILPRTALAVTALLTLAAGIPTAASAAACPPGTPGIASSSACQYWLVPMFSVVQHMRPESTLPPGATPAVTLDPAKPFPLWSEMTPLAHPVYISHGSAGLDVYYPADSNDPAPTDGQVRPDDGPQWRMGAATAAPWTRVQVIGSWLPKNTGMTVSDSVVAADGTVRTTALGRFTSTSTGVASIFVTPAPVVGLHRLHLLVDGQPSEDVTFTMQNGTPSWKLSAAVIDAWRKTTITGSWLPKNATYTLLETYTRTVNGQPVKTIAGLGYATTTAQGVLSAQVLPFGLAPGAHTLLAQGPAGFSATLTVTVR